MFHGSDRRDEAREGSRCEGDMEGRKGREGETEKIKEDSAMFVPREGEGTVEAGPCSTLPYELLRGDEERYIEDFRAK